MARRGLDLTGLEVNCLKVLGKAEQDKYRSWLWLCECECGKQIKVSASVLNKKTYKVLRVSKTCRQIQTWNERHQGI